MTRRRHARAVAAPCPGCGEPNKTRFASEVCRECKELFAEVKVLRAALETRMDRRKKMVYLSVPEINWAHWFPYIRHEDSGHPVQHAFAELVHAIGDRVSYVVARSSGGYTDTITNMAPYSETPAAIQGTQGSHDNPILAVPRGTKEALEKLYTAIQALSHHAYEEGKEDGAHWLMRLHKGEVTLDEMNKAIKLEPFDEKAARRR